MDNQENTSHSARSSSSKKRNTPSYESAVLLVCLLLSFALGCSETGSLQAKAFFGDAGAQAALGRLYYYGQDGMEKDSDKAYELFEKSADGGNADGKFMVGIAYHNGEGVERDLKLVEKFYLEAADMGHAKAQYNLAHLYGSQRRDRKSIAMFKKAASNGHAHAQYMLGDRYLLGDGVPEDYAEAVKWYTKASEQGHGGAALQLGKAYMNGWGVEVDHKKALEFLTLAVDRGSPGAKYPLYDLYTREIYAEQLPDQKIGKDPASTVMWTILAMAEKGETNDAEAKDLKLSLRVLKADLTVEQYEEGRRLALEWDNGHSEPSDAETIYLAIHGVR